MTLRSRIGRLLATSALGIALAAAPAAAIGAPTAYAADGAPDCPVTYAGSTATATCDYTGEAQTFTVPPGVTSLIVTVDGASGGSVAGIAHGGNGGRVVATLDVEPGAVLTVIVGEAGSSGGGRTFGGGGAPGSDSMTSASGGGGSFVQTADGTNLLIAGGGGGAANRNCGIYGPADGGDGGGTHGGPGSSTCPPGASGAGGGTSGSSAGIGKGGDGGDIPGSFGIPGGGGGGGYAGGDGGRVVVVSPGDTHLGGGGGGGSGYCPPAVSCDFTSGAHYGDGQVTFAWDVSAAQITSTETAPFTIAADTSFTITADGLPVPELSVGAGDLPAGLTFTDNHDGTATISGAPAAGTAGTYAATVTASSPAGNDAQALTLTVARAAPAVTVSAEPASGAHAGQDVAITATVTGGAGPATGGTVDVAVAGAVLCGAVPVIDGVATCVSDAMAVGRPVITATFSGDQGTYDSGRGSLDYQVLPGDTVTTSPTSGMTRSTPATPTSTSATRTTATPTATTLSPTPATPTPTTLSPTTPTPTTVNPTDITTTRPSAVGELTNPTPTTQTLAATGTAPVARAIVGLLLVLAGAGLAAAGRRRSHQH